MKIKQPYLFSFALGMLFALALMLMLQPVAEKPHEEGLHAVASRDEAELVQLQTKIQQLEALLQQQNPIPAAEVSNSPSGQEEVKGHEVISFQVLPGWSGERIRDELVQAEVISDGAQFEEILKERRLQLKLKTGEYQFQRGMSPEEVIDRLTGKKSQSE